MYRYGMKNQTIEELQKENKELKNLIAAINTLDMAVADYEDYQPLLNKVLDEVAN